MSPLLVVRRGGVWEAAAASVPSRPGDVETIEMEAVGIFLFVTRFSRLFSVGGWLLVNLSGVVDSLGELRQRKIKRCPDALPCRGSSQRTGLREGAGGPHLRTDGYITAGTTARGRR